MEKQEQLRSTVNTPAMESKVLAAARHELDRRMLTADFEHGQWWVSHPASGAQWAVTDHVTPGGYEYFGFEQVTQGDDE